MSSVRVEAGGDFIQAECRRNRRRSEMKARSLLQCLIPVVCLAVLSAQPVAADEQGLLLRRGFFKELTNAEATAFTIQSFRISGDGAKIAYFGWDGTNHSLWVMDADGQNKTWSRPASG
jgi:hypothetical protein